MAIRQTLVRTALVCVVFGLLSGIALSPLTFFLNSRVPGAPPDQGRVLDYYHFHWNLWWLRHAALNGQDIWYTNKVLAPYTHNLTYHSLTASMLPFYVVLEPLLGHLRAANTIIWISLTLTGVLMYALLRSQHLSRLTALWGGIGLALSPYMLDHAGSGHLNLITAWWLPLILFAWERTRRTLTPGWAALAGLILWGMWFTDTLVVLWGGLLLGPYALYSLAQSRRRGRLVLLGGLTVGITVALAWVLGPLRQTLDFDTSQLPPARLLTLRYYALSFESLFLPRLGGVQGGMSEHDETLGFWMVVLCWAAIIGAGGQALLRRFRPGGTVARHEKESAHNSAVPGRWFWLLAALPALILTLGPDVTLGGLQIPLPFRIVHALFDGQMRTPLRFLPPATAGLILFLAHTGDPWLRRQAVPLRSLLAAVGVLALLADFGALSPFPTIPALKPYAFHRMMRAEHDADYDYVVLDVPSGPFTGWRDLGLHPEAMVYGITHEKRMVSGLLSRIPINEHLFYETSALFGWLTDSRPLDASAAAVELIRYVRDWPIGYVVVHLNWLPEAKTQDVLAFLNVQRDLCSITIEGDAVLYRTSSHPKGCPPRLPPQTAPGTYTIPLGERGDEVYIGAGWYAHEPIGGVSGRWAGGQNEALLITNLPSGSGYTLTLRATAFDTERQLKVVVGRMVDNQPVVLRLGMLSIAPGGWQEYTLRLPADYVNQGTGDITLSLSADGLMSAAKAGLSDDTRPLAIAYDWIMFRAAAP
jgi:hypothetical protein